MIVNCQMSLVTDTEYHRDYEYIKASEKILHMLKCLPKYEITKYETKTRIEQNKNDSEKKFSCVVCPGMNFKNQQTLSNHIQAKSL